MEREGIPVSFLAGSSMGGLIAALYAAGWSGEQLEEEVLRMSRIHQLFKLVDVSRSRRGLLEGNRVRGYLRELLEKDLTFDDLRIPLALTAVDLRTGCEVILREGSLYDAILATIAVPGLFSPVRKDNFLLVDGGVLNNVPADVVRLMGADVVVAVDVSPTFPMEIADESGMKGEDDIPSLFPGFAIGFYVAELIMVSALTQVRLREMQPDILLRPSIPSNISIFWGLTHAAEAIVAGEESVLLALPDLISYI